MNILITFNNVFWIIPLSDFLERKPKMALQISSRSAFEVPFAEDVGFEPTREVSPWTAYHAVAFSHSANLSKST